MPTVTTGRIIRAIMGVRLVHHTAESIDGGVSPFATELSTIVQGGKVDIACPYISVNYIEGLLARCPSWRILTDAEEFISTSRDLAVAFLVEHRNNVRHLRDLHAKVVIGINSVLVGSANLTEKGLAGRDEMGVLFENDQKLHELRAWFDELWGQAEEIVAGDLARFVATLPGPTKQPPPDQRIPCSARRVRASMPALTKVGAPRDPDGSTRLVEKLRQAPSRMWAAHYLDLVRTLLVALELEESDTRLVMSTPSGPELAVTLCQRYVLSAFRKRQTALSMMLPKEPSVLDGFRVVRWGNGFRPRKHEGAERGPYFPTFEVLDPGGLPERLTTTWLDLARRELGRGRYSSYRDRHHRPDFYRVAMDNDFRREILDEAFPSTARAMQ